jgi:hypothetical protein
LQTEDKNVKARRKRSEANNVLAAVVLAEKGGEEEHSRSKKSLQRGDANSALARRVQEKEDEAETILKRFEADDTPNEVA